MGMMSPQEALAYIHRELARKQADEVPEGWFSAADMASQSGQYQHNVKRTLDKGVCGGLLEARKFNVATAGGLRPTTHYRWIKPPQPGCAS